MAKVVVNLIKKDCRNFDKCVKYTEMTLDSNAISCGDCPAYEPS